MNYIQEFLKEHPIYEKMTFHSKAYPVETHLHPILPASQAIIDSMLEEGKKHIAIVFPDDDINILPLVVAKYLSNVQEIPKYAHSIFDDIRPGQHLKLGKSVVEYIAFDKVNERIDLYVGKPTKLRYGNTVYEQPPSKYSTPFQNYHLYFERSNGALTKEKTFLDERKRIRSKIEEEGIADIDLIALKRTILNKSIAILSPKKDFKEFLDDFFVENSKCQKIITIGEFDEAADSGTSLYNTGQLDCLPGLIVSSKLNEIAYGVSLEKLKTKIDGIVVTQAKYNEVINNLNDFRKCLRTEIPFIMFIPETEFETFPVLEEMGFEFWIWNPQMLKYGGLSSKNLVTPKNTLFGDLSRKVYNAAVSDYALKTIKYEELRKANYLIRQLVKNTFENGNQLNQIARLMNKIIKNFIDIASPVSESIEQKLMQLFADINTRQELLKPQYEGTEIWNDIQIAVDKLNHIFMERNTPKSIILSELIENSIYKKTIVLVPNRYAFIEELETHLRSLYNGKEILVMRSNDFLHKQYGTLQDTDHLIVTFFDNSDYIQIKKTYCYKKLTFVLYTFENSWRRGFVNRYENCIQRDAVGQRAKKIISRQVKLDKWESAVSFDANDNDEAAEEMTEYNFERELITDIIKQNNTSAEQSDSAECIPVIFDQDTIGFFSPSHYFIDITPLCRGDLDRPAKKEAGRLHKGDIVLIRQSDKDIIYEKANELMKERGEISLRKLAELWVRALQKVAKGKRLSSVKNRMNKYGADCDLNQIRYWLNGETIRPEKDSVVEALSTLCPQILPKSKVQTVLNAGARVQEYHREAGRWMTNELKYKAKDILEIYQSGNVEGHIDEIGDVHVYVVESVLEREYVDRSSINKVEVIT